MRSRALAEFIEQHPRLFVLTGAGCSTDSGIPDYRDTQGNWKRQPPVNYSAFMGSSAVRQRYWARSFAGWQRISRARPNGAHTALARLERCGRIELLVTQNVDGLHQAAGCERVIDLHGRIDRVRCMGCGRLSPRAALQEKLLLLNGTWRHLEAPTAPDGDADLDGVIFSGFTVPTCVHCGGVLKPDVVFFGESVPRPRVERSMNRLACADALLIIGSSLMVYSGYRFVQTAVRLGLPIAALNLGRTRADPLLTLKVTAPCAEVLALL